MNIDPVLPGFVDLQVNGYLGVDFSDADLSEDAFVHACRRLRAAGTVAFLPTIITSPLAVYERNLKLMARIMSRAEFRGMIPGIHLEGPFLSSQPGAVGAHNPALVRKPDTDLLRRFLEWSDGFVRLITLAPELDGADQLAREAIAAGILVSAGHTLAGASDLERLARAGARLFTHLGNALPPLLPKFENPIWACLGDARYTAMVIADGHHLPDPVLRTILRAKGLERIVVVSDASPVAGLPPGAYRTLGNDAILEPSGRLHNPQKGCLVGSSATLLQCMNHLAAISNLSAQELATIGFHNPLRLLGMDAHALPVAPTYRLDPLSRRWTAAEDTARLRAP